MSECWLNCLLELISYRDEIYDYINGIRIIDSTKGKSILFRIEFWISSLDVKEQLENIIIDNFNLSSFKLTHRIHQNLKEK